MSGFIDWNKTTRSKDYRGSTSFATFMIIARWWTSCRIILMNPKANIDSSGMLLPGRPLRFLPLRLSPALDQQPNF